MVHIIDMRMHTNDHHSDATRGSPMTDPQLRGRDPVTGWNGAGFVGSLGSGRPVVRMTIGED
jgi:hypothetical protein